MDPEDDEEEDLVVEERSISLAEEDDFELAIGLSVSDRVDTRPSMLSSQQYREDERRRRDLLYSQDMMADSSTEYEPTKHPEDFENVENPVEHEMMEEDLEEGEIPAPLLETTGDSNDEEFVELRASQYVPPMMLMEQNQAEEESESNLSELEDNLLNADSSEEEEENSPEITMKERWVGEKENPFVWNSAKVMTIPESKSKQVGVRPAPTTIVKPRVEIVKVLIMIIIMFIMIITIACIKIIISISIFINIIIVI